MSNQEANDEEAYTLVAKAIHFLSEAHPSKPSLREVSEHVGLSEFHFQRLFVKWAGVSPKEFMQALTLERAKSALAESSSLLSASIDLGLSGPSRLHDLFVTVEAMSPGEFKRGGAELTIFWDVVPTKFGPALIGETDRGICRISFVETKELGERELQQLLPNAVLVNSIERVQPTAVELHRRMSGESPSRTLGLLLAGSPLRLQVWRALLEVPKGALVTYGQVADHIGSSGVRAVATAIGTNAIAYLVPCHRVIRSTGAFGEYRWGLARKLALIGTEYV